MASIVRLDGHEVSPHVCLASFVRLAECLGQLAALGDELLSRYGELFRVLLSHFRSFRLRAPVSVSADKRAEGGAVEIDQLYACQRPHQRPAHAYTGGG
jgi:hypothetical protein